MSKLALQTECNISKYKVVEHGNLSIGKTNKKVFWVVINEKINEECAIKVGLAVAGNDSLDEASVYIYDNENGARSGVIHHKQFDVFLVNGKVMRVIKNLFFK